MTPQPPVATAEQRSAALVRKAAQHLTPLQFYRDETSRLTGVVGPSHTRVLPDNAATLDALQREELTGATIIDIARPCAQSGK